MFVFVNVRVRVVVLVRDNGLVRVIINVRAVGDDIVNVVVTACDRVIDRAVALVIATVPVRVF